MRAWRRGRRDCPMRGLGDLAAVALLLVSCSNGIELIRTDVLALIHDPPLQTRFLAGKTRGCATCVCCVRMADMRVGPLVLKNVGLVLYFAPSAGKPALGT